MVSTVSDVCNVSNVQLHVLIKIKIIKKKESSENQLFASRLDRNCRLNPFYQEQIEH